jgi:hypothetical protein
MYWILRSFAICFRVYIYVISVLSLLDLDMVCSSVSDIFIVSCVCFLFDLDKEFACKLTFCDFHFCNLEKSVKLIWLVQ